MRETELAVEQFKRELLAIKLSACTESQQALFHRIWPSSIKGKDLMYAIDLCERTLMKNAKGRA